MLSLSGVIKRYGDRAAVDGLTLEVRKGEIFGLLGPNGAGKTTTVGLAVGLLTPDAGSVAVEGASPSDTAVRARLGVAPQSLAIYDELTGRENLRFFGSLYGGADVDRALEFVGLSDRADDRVRTYSGGMKRRLNLAVAIVHDPPLVLLDEPTVGVDPQARNAIFENILALKRDGRTIVYTTHYMEEAQRLCDRVGIIDRGKLLAVDSVDALIAAHGGRSVLVADGRRIETDDPLAELRAIDGVRDFHVERPTLEAVFLNLTGRSLRD